MTTETTPEDRPLVYLLHGLLGTGYAHFGKQVSAWRERYRVVPIDLPGHGNCPLDAEYEYSPAAFDYVSALTGKFGPGHVIGLSYLGGPLAVRLARDRPDSVRSLVLSGFAPGLSRDVFLTWCAGFHRLPEQNTELAEEYTRLHGERWRKTLSAFTEQAERSYRRVLVQPADIGELSTHVLLLNGSHKSVERSAAERADGYGSWVGGTVIEDAGHLVGTEQPERFNSAVESFWERSAEE